MLNLSLNLHLKSSVADPKNLTGILLRITCTNDNDLFYDSHRALTMRGGDGGYRPVASVEKQPPSPPPSLGED